ncbi:hypothetical protein ACFYU5_03470 [Nocardia aobensis]|uniref:Uncharacterized protein n=1 Tax=Nocardia aobensis TaxID=257277 RepID=A0ABW6NYL9_9NOCA
MCQGNHDVARAVTNGGLRAIDRIVREYGGYLAADLDAMRRDLRATVLSNELRSLTVQAYTDKVHAMWALTVRENYYAVLNPEAVPPVPFLRAAQWRVVMFRRHLVATLPEDVLKCVGLAEEGDLFHRWEPAATLEGPDRHRGVIVRMPRGGVPGIVHGDSGNGTEPVELELNRRDARSYAHCRQDHDHLPGQRVEEDCARLRLHDKITYVHMRRNPAGLHVAFLASRDTPATLPHLSGIGLTPIQ